MIFASSGHLNSELKRINPFEIFWFVSWINSIFLKAILNWFWKMNHLHVCSPGRRSASTAAWTAPRRSLKPVMGFPLFVQLYQALGRGSRRPVHIRMLVSRVSCRHRASGGDGHVLPTRQHVAEHARDIPVLLGLPLWPQDELGLCAAVHRLAPVKWMAFAHVHSSHALW